MGPSAIIYNLYEKPIINQQVHQQCIEQGYDTYNSWEGKGLFPKKPLHVKCMFVENRQDLQGNLNINMKK
jgi:hypothetical protein